VVGEVHRAGEAAGYGEVLCHLYECHWWVLWVHGTVESGSGEWGVLWYEVPDSYDAGYGKGAVHAAG